MKKLISLLLTLTLCLCALTPVTAEGLGSLFSNLQTSTAPEAFTCTFDPYKLYFDLLASSMFSVDPVWSVEDGKDVATITGYGKVYVAKNAEGYITSLNTSATFSASDTSGANNFGMLVALIALTAKVAEDINFLNSDIDAYTNELLAVMYGLLSDSASALEGPISVSGYVGGDTATFTLGLTMETMQITFGFSYEP